jgi:hypothetical protein
VTTTEWRERGRGKIRSWGRCYGHRCPPCLIPKPIHAPLAPPPPPQYLWGCHRPSGGRQHGEGRAEGGLESQLQLPEATAVAPYSPTTTLPSRKSTLRRLHFSCSTGQRLPCYFCLPDVHACFSSRLLVHLSLQNASCKLPPD